MSDYLFSFEDPYHNQVLRTAEQQSKPVMEPEIKQAEPKKARSKKRKNSSNSTSQTAELVSLPVSTKGYDGPFEEPELDTSMPYGMPVFFKHMGGYQPKHSVPEFKRGMGRGSDEPVFNEPMDNEQTIREHQPNGIRSGKSILHKLFGPSEDELEATRNGMRWHWYMENRPMWASYPHENEVVWNGVDRENQYIAQLLKAQKASQMSPLAEARRMGQYQTMYKQWEKMAADGKFDDGNGGLSKEGVDAYERIKDAFLQEFPDKNPDTVMLPMHNQIAARRNVATGQMMKQWSAINQMDSTYNQLRQLDQSGQLYTSEGLINPQYAPVLDLFMNRVAAILTGSNGALADAEKIRLQYEFATEEVKGILDKNIREYFDSLASVARAAMSGNARLAANEDLRTLAEGGKDMSSLGRIATAIERLVGNEDNELHSIGTALDANSEAFEQSIQRFMLQGYVDITKLLGSAQMARTNLANDWNKSAELNRRDDRITPMAYDYQFKPPSNPHFPMPTYVKYTPPAVKPDATNQRIARRYKSKTANNSDNATGYGSGIPGWN